MSTSPPYIYTLSLHDALPISRPSTFSSGTSTSSILKKPVLPARMPHFSFIGPLENPFHERSTMNARSEEHTSELQSLTNLVCRLLLEKKNQSEDHWRARQFAY